MVLLSTADPASAHASSHSKNYVTTVDSIEPVVTGLTVTATKDGSYLMVTNHTGQTVTVLGYEHEPYLKITPQGVQQNLRAPTVYLNDNIVGPMPGDVSADAAPVWQEISTSNTYRYHDHRIDWGGVGLPAVVKQNRGKPHLIAHWTVPMLVGHTPVTVTGTLRWRPSGFPPWVLVTLGVIGLMVAVIAFSIALDAKRARERATAPDPTTLAENRPPVAPH
jgi:hypothetical protein